MYDDYYKFSNKNLIRNPRESTKPVIKQLVIINKRTAYMTSINNTNIIL